MKHGGFNEIILFTSLTFNFKLDENEQKNELTLMNDGNDANSTRANSKWLYYVTNVYGFFILYSLVCRYLLPFH